MYDVSEAVARCVRALDEELVGWHARIDLATLKMWHPDWCVAGQLFGNFYSSKTRDFIARHTPSDLPYVAATQYIGLASVSSGYLQSEIDLMWDVLNEAWKAVIERRQIDDALSREFARA